MCPFLSAIQLFSGDGKCRKSVARANSSGIYNTRESPVKLGTGDLQNPDNQEGMFIRVALPNKEEGLFNADCSVALLLDTVKKRHNIPQKDQIDLCSEDGVVKHLLSHLSAGSGVTFFELRELCLVVRVVPSEESHSDEAAGPVVQYVPALDEYQHDEDLMAALNDADADSGKTSGDRRKGQKRSNHRSGGKPGTPDGGKSRTAGNKPSSKRQANNTK